MPHLPSSISPGDSGHIADHEAVHALLDNIDDEGFEVTGFLEDTLANRPAAAAINEGWLFYATDEPNLYRSDGTNWIPVFRAPPSTLAGLDLTEPEGTIRRVTDGVRGIWMKQATQWFSLNGEEVNVQEFGATGDGSTDDTTAIQNAANAAAGGILFFPEPDVDYLVTAQITLSANTIVLGSGWGTIVRRVDGSVFEASSTASPRDNIHFRDIAVEVNTTSTGGFHDCIDFDGTSESSVKNCKLIASGSIASGDNRHGVLARGATDFWVVGNYFDQTQCKLNGASEAALRNFVIGNVSVNAHDVAITSVINSDTGSIEDLVIADNIIFNTTSSGSIFFGTDGTAVSAATAPIHRVTVRGNIIKGPTSRNVALIYGIPSGNSRDWNIIGNEVDCGSPAPAGQDGILISQSADSPQIRSLTISGNVVRDAGRFGIFIGMDNALGLSISGNTISGGTHSIVARGGCTIVGNHLLTGRGIKVQSSPIEGLFVVAGNILDDPAPDFDEGAIEIAADSGESFRVLCYGNLIEGSDQLGIHTSGAGDISGQIYGNLLDDITKGEIRVRHTGAGIINIFRNRGHVSEAEGTATIPSGSTSVTVTHTLDDYTPAAGEINVTPTNNPTNDPGNFWVDTITSTEFNINVRADPGTGGATFSWAVWRID